MATIARAQLDTNLALSTPPSGHYPADLQTQISAIVAQLNQLLAPYANGDLNGFVAVELEIDVADHATQNIDLVIPYKMDVRDFSIVAGGANGANANTVQLNNVTAAANITDALSMNGKGAGDVVRMANLQNRSIAAGGTLRIIQTKIGGVASFTARISAIIRP